jgi:hypothetical protein
MTSDDPTCRPDAPEYNQVPPTVPAGTADDGIAIRSARLPEWELERAGLQRDLAAAQSEIRANKSCDQTVPRVESDDRRL